MFTAADLVQAIQRRLQLVAPHLRRPPGEFPPGWKQWFESMSVRAGAVTGATATALVEVFLQRPLAERPRSMGELTRWRAFNTLWRQEWQGPEPEDRKVHWFASALSAGWHVIVALLLLWFWYTQRAYIEETTKRRGETVVQIEFVGRGAPEEVGGGQDEEPADEAPADMAQTAQATPQPAAPAPAQAVPLSPPVAAPEAAVVDAQVPDAPIPDVPQREVPEPQVPPSPPVQQAVVVSAPTPDASDFVLAPPTPRVPQPQVSVPEVTAPSAMLRAVEIPEPVQPIRREAAPRPIAAPQIEARIPEVARREVAAPVEQRQLPRVTEPSVAQPALRTPEATVRTRDVPAPPAAAASTSAVQAPSAAAQAEAAATVPPGTTSSPDARPAATTASPGAARPSGSAPATASSGQGPKPVTAPGGFPTPAKSDDWGASSRDVPGGQRGEPLGLYDSEGGPRLAEQPVNTGQPPGTLDDRIVDLDRSGTWLKRKPVGYEPTSFDKYWLPNETLLAEWVRKGIKKMAIPIPGTSKKIDCVVSILALGGACSISDPNLNDQPAQARPPPDIPFKPHLQEGNGSIPPPQQEG